MDKSTKGMRPQDVVILLKKTTAIGKSMMNKQLAESLQISASEISESLERSRIANLIDSKKKRVNILALLEFLVHGIKYVFPVLPSGIVRGIATATSTETFSHLLNTGSEKYVWQYAAGDTRGQAILPLYPTVPAVVGNDQELYELLTLVDVLRIGCTREREIAQEELSKRLKRNGEN